MGARKGRPKPPGSGKKKGTKNKKTLMRLDAVRLHTDMLADGTRLNGRDALTKIMHDFMAKAELYRDSSVEAERKLHEHYLEKAGAYARELLSVELPKLSAQMVQLHGNGSQQPETVTIDIFNSSGDLIKPDPKRIAAPEAPIDVSSFDDGDEDGV